MEKMAQLVVSQFNLLLVFLFPMYEQNAYKLCKARWNTIGSIILLPEGKNGRKRRITSEEVFPTVVLVSTTRLDWLCMGERTNGG